MKTRTVFGVLLITSIVLSACASAFGSSAPLVQEGITSTAHSETNTPTDLESTPYPLPTPTILADVSPTPDSLPEESPPKGAALEFLTDFSKHTTPYSEILSGGPPKDGIPALDEPTFVDVKEAESWLGTSEPVVLVIVGDEARAYPLQILTWHEIVNDSVGDLPLTITFCPLCNTAIAFKRTFDGRVLDFGTTGRLRFSNLIMYDRQTETWWQQASGEAIAGEYAGSQLDFYPASIISWGEFKSAYPKGSVLSRQTGFNRSYGRNPYSGYDNINNSPFFYLGPETPGVLPPVARVLTLDLNGEAVAYPYTTLENIQVVNDTVGGQPIAVFWAAGTASALDAGSIAEGRDVGSAAAYYRELDGLELNFEIVDRRIIDQETGSEWNVLGQAVAGELAGKQLSPVISINHFWFSWAAFRPETRIFQVE